MRINIKCVWLWGRLMLKLPNENRYSSINPIYFLLISGILALFPTYLLIDFLLPQYFENHNRFGRNDLTGLLMIVPLWSFGFLFYSIKSRPPLSVLLLLGVAPLAVWTSLVVSGNFFLTKFGISFDSLMNSNFTSRVLSAILIIILLAYSIMNWIITFLNFKRWRRGENLIFPARFHGRVELPAGIPALICYLIYVGFSLVTSYLAYSRIIVFFNA